MPDLQVKSFTTRYTGLANALTSPVKISENFNPATPSFDFSKPPNPDDDNFEAIWDTGATHSVITQKVVQRLDL